MKRSDFINKWSLSSNERERKIRDEFISDLDNVTMKPSVDELMTLFYNSLDWYHGEITGIKGKWLELELKKILNK